MTDPAEDYGPAKNTQNHGEVASLGELVIDHVIPVEDRHHEQWSDENWWPGEGESIEIDEVPEYVAEEAGAVFPGGKATNQALAAAQSGADSRFHGKLGEREELEYLEDAGVDLRLDREPGGMTGEAYVFVDEDGDNRIACAKDGEGLIDPEHVRESYEQVMEADYLLLTNGMREDALRTALEMLEGEEDRPTTIFDPSPIPGAGEILDYRSVDYATPNEHEYEALSKEFGDHTTVLKTTSDGAYLDGELYEAPDVEPVDTTAAGDTFNGYLAGRLSQGHSMDEAVEYAVHAASLSVTREGAQPAIPSFDEVREFMEG